jgi:hypothetical protein
MLSEADRLLLSWLAWQQGCDEAPAKTRDSIHIRTTVYLFKRYRENGTDFATALGAEARRMQALPVPEPRLME